MMKFIMKTICLLFLGLSSAYAVISFNPTLEFFNELPDSYDLQVIGNSIPTNTSFCDNGFNIKGIPSEVIQPGDSAKSTVTCDYSNSWSMGDYAVTFLLRVTKSDNSSTVNLYLCQVTAAWSISPPSPGATPVYGPADVTSTGCKRVLNLPVDKLNITFDVDNSKRLYTPIKIKGTSPNTN